MRALVLSMEATILEVASLEPRVVRLPHVVIQLHDTRRLSLLVSMMAGPMGAADSPVHMSVPLGQHPPLLNLFLHVVVFGASNRLRNLSLG